MFSRLCGPWVSAVVSWFTILSSGFLVYAKSKEVNDEHLKELQASSGEFKIIE
jgi:hypothetical protein